MGHGRSGLRGALRIGIIAILASLLLALGASAAAAEELKDFSGGAFQILAPGDEGAQTPVPMPPTRGLSTTPSRRPAAR